MAKRIPPEISTSTWKPGDPGRTALIHGTLRYTGHGCPFLQEGGATIWVVWPAGYRLQFGPTDALALVGPDGVELRNGDRIEAGGSAAGATAEAGMPCIPAGATLTTIEAAITKLG